MFSASTRPTDCRIFAGSVPDGCRLAACPSTHPRAAANDSTDSVPPEACGMRKILPRPRFPGSAALRLRKEKSGPQAAFEKSVWVLLLLAGKLCLYWSANGGEHLFRPLGFRSVRL